MRRLLVPFMLSIVACAPKEQPSPSSQEPLAASTSEPPEVAEMKRRRSMRQPAAAPSPPLTDLLEIIRRQPGGPEKLERARQAGARIPQGAALDDDRQHVDDGEVEPTLTSHVIQATSLSVTRAAPEANDAAIGSLAAAALFPFMVEDYAYWGPLTRWSAADAANSPVGSVYDVKSYVSVTFGAASSGWYIVNVVATQTPAEMRKWQTSGGYSLLQSFARPSSGTYSSYPVLVNLASGIHYFAWANIDAWVYVSEVRVYKL